MIEVEAIQRIAIAKMRADEPEQAVELLRSVEASEMEIGMPRRKMVWQLNLAEGLRIARRFDEAIRHNEEILRTARLHADHEVIMNTLGNLGLCLVVVGRIREAEEAFLESVELPRTRKSGEAFGNYLYNRGWIRVTLGRWRSAARWFQRAVEAYLEYGSVERAGGVLGQEAFCRARIGDIVGPVPVSGEWRRKG